MTTAVNVDILSELRKFMKRPADQFDAATKLEVESFFSYCMEGMENDSQKLLATLFIKALNKRVRSESIGENIYLGKFEISQIQLFNILIEKFPFVRFSQQITNSAVVAAMEGSEQVTIIDIGIGQGTQVLNIIEQARKLDGLKQLHIVGIEPYGEALARAEAAILACNETAPFSISFTAIHEGVEQVDFSALDQNAGKIIVNASLALHHVQSAAKRSEILGKIKQLNPAALILIEPNVNHYETDFYTRFNNCYQHFYSIFQVIDRIENISEVDKNALKLFFGREIEDVIGKEEKDRFEKHEPASHWIERLKANHFTLNTDFMSAPIDPGCGVEIKYHQEGFLGFSFREETVLAVIYAN